MRSLVVSITAAVALLVGIFAAAPAYASHGAAFGVVSVDHLTNRGIRSTFYENAVSCTGTSCSVTVQVSKTRDYNRYLRWCQGVTSVPVTVLAGDFVSNNVFCQGPSTWRIRVSGFLSADTTGQTPTTHNSDVAITVNVTGP